MAAVMLRSYQFRKEREKTWRELEKMTSRIERRGIGSLTPRQLIRLPVLYRATISSLSVARAISLDRNLVEYLESQVARAYIVIYATKRGFWRTVVRFVTATFPRTVRRFKWHIALSALFLLLGGVAGFFLTLDDPERFYSFVSDDMAQGRTPAATTGELREVLYETRTSAGDLLFAFATFLFTHNSKVGILCFALGFAAGVPVFFLMFTNGLLLGAFAALYHSRGLSVDLWGWLLPHGVTELTAIVVCGGAGLVLAQSLLFPGRLTRLRSLAVRGREAAVLVLGAVLMLFFAGLIEGILRQAVTSVPVRYSVVVVTAVLLTLYFARAGRGRA